MIVNGKKITGYGSVMSSKPYLATISGSIDEDQTAYVNFASSIMLPIRRKVYVIELKNYLRSPSVSFSAFNELLGRDPCLIAQEIIDILIGMLYRRYLHYSKQNLFLSALTHFSPLNDVTMNHKKIKKFMSTSENKYL